MRSAAILAGGLATRFGGRDKSALIVDGRTILERQIGEVSAVPDLGELLLVVGRRGPQAPHPRVRTIEDLVPGSGPLGGIHAALAHARGEAVAVIAGDMPYVTAPLLAFLLDLSRHHDLVVPRTERGYHPLCGVYTRACLEPIARRLAERRLKVLDILDDAESASARRRG
jgi:molybdopterin-guanine dinucleotide biosynthesis protein A